MNRVLQRLAVLLLLALGAGCGREAPEAALRPVTLPALEGLPEAAQTQIAQQHARTQASGDGEAYGTLGQILFTYDFLDPAEAAFLNAEALLPEDPRWPYYLGMLYRQQGAFAEAAARFEQVAERAPDDVLARVRLAEAYLELGRTGDARALLGEVLRADPDLVFARFLLGQVAYETGAYREAADHYEAVLARQPEATQVHAPLALAYRALGDDARSRNHLEQRGNGLVRLADPRVQALDAFKQATGATAQTQGEALLNAGRYAEAVAVLERAAGQEGAGASTFLNLGVARAYAGDQDGAVEAFEEALRRDPTKSNAHFNLGAIYAARGQPERAEAAFRAAATHDPRSGRAHLELAEILRRSGRCAEAVPHFEQALAILPGDVGARQHLALCYLR
ncbi:MAG: tetratricopeptide repeat protein, partial [Rhodothermales bacterium]|nr:tetratricopeptide repeat protein [Rhodothermales bacterium]